MKKFKKIALPLLAALFIFGVAGCANGEDENNNNMDMNEEEMENMDMNDNKDEK